MIGKIVKLLLPVLAFAGGAVGGDLLRGGPAPQAEAAAGVGLLILALALLLFWVFDRGGRLDAAAR